MSDPLELFVEFLGNSFVLCGSHESRFEILPDEKQRCLMCRAQPIFALQLIKNVIVSQFLRVAFRAAMFQLCDEIEDLLPGRDAARIFSLELRFKLPDLYGQRRCTIFGIAERAGEQQCMLLLVLGALRADGRQQSMKRLLERSAYSLCGREHHGADVAARHPSGRRSGGGGRVGSLLIAPFTHEGLNVAAGRADLFADPADIRVLAT